MNKLARNLRYIKFKKKLDDIEFQTKIEKEGKWGEWDPDQISNIASFSPYLGGLASGLIKPAKGTNRMESAVVTGATGLGGGLIGGLAGSTVGTLAAAGVLALMKRGQTGDRAKNMSNLESAILGTGMIGGGYVGSSLGTFAGTRLGRLMAERDTVTPTELVKIMKANAAAQGQVQGGAKA